MTYLDRPWRPPEEFPAGDWVPEMDHRDWLDRHRGLGRVPWVNRDGLSDADRQQLATLAPTVKAEYLRVLGGDIGSVQRDGFLYANFLEELKRHTPEPDGDEDADKAADRVVERMKAMGLVSASLDEQDGGPPKHQSPRPWRAVMNWLSGLLQKVGRFLVNSIEAFTILAKGLFGDAAEQASVSFSASIPPAVSFAVNAAFFTDTETWRHFKEFIDAILKQMGKIVEPTA
jgi:hypothetical protein